MKKVGYNEFSEDVLTIFKKIINKYDFKIIEKSVDKVILKSSLCIIDISLVDFFEQETRIKPINSKKSYRVDIIMSLQGNKLPSLSEKEMAIYNNNNNYRDYIKIRLERDALSLFTYLKNILEGDFEWIGEYEKVQNEMPNLIEKVQTLSPTHPTYKKYKANNHEWIQEIKGLTK